MVLAAAGSGAFSAGADLKEMAAHPAGHVETTDPRRRGIRLFETILGVSKPTIVAVNGAAIGAGFEMAMACDLRVAVHGAFFALPEAKLGLGSLLGTHLLPRLLPRAVALQMLYTGEPMDAEEAHRWGLVNILVDREELETATSRLAETIAANAPLSVRRYKHMLTNAVALPLGDALRLEGGPDPYTSRDRAEGVRAFLEGRRPVWQGR